MEVILLLALVFGGLGFVYPTLWIVALVLLVGWIFGFLPQSKSREGSPDRLASRRVTGARTKAFAGPA